MMISQASDLWLVFAILLSYRYAPMGKTCCMLCFLNPNIITNITPNCTIRSHYNDVIMSTMASQNTSLTIVYSTIYSGADQRKHQSSASLAFVRGIRRWPVNSPHKGPVTRKKFPFDDVIMGSRWLENTIQIPPWDCFTSIIQDDIIIVSSHYSDVIISTMASQVTGVTIVCSSASLGLVQIKEYTKALRHWPLWMESTSNAENVSIWWRLHENGNLHMLWYSMTPWLYVYDIFMVELVSALNKANSYVHMHA